MERSSLIAVVALCWMVCPKDLRAAAVHRSGHGESFRYNRVAHGLKDGNLITAAYRYRLAVRKWDLNESVDTAIAVVIDAIAALRLSGCVRGYGEKYEESKSKESLVHKPMFLVSNKGPTPTGKSTRSATEEGREKHRENQNTLSVAQAER